MIITLDDGPSESGCERLTDIARYSCHKNMVAFPLVTSSFFYLPETHILNFPLIRSVFESWRVSLRVLIPNTTIGDISCMNDVLSVPFFDRPSTMTFLIKIGWEISSLLSTSECIVRERLCQSCCINFNFPLDFKCVRAWHQDNERFRFLRIS
jgi:hypothetical protein